MIYNAYIWFLRMYNYVIWVHTESNKMTHQELITLNACYKCCRMFTWILNKCSENCMNSASCDRFTGYCNGGCKPGWTGNKCDQSKRMHDSCFFVQLLMLYFSWYFIRNFEVFVHINHIHVIIAHHTFDIFSRLLFL